MTAMDMVNSSHIMIQSALRIVCDIRAAGKQSYEKLLVSYYAFKASGLEDLAESSRNLLLRRGYFKGSTDEVA